MKWYRRACPVCGGDLHDSDDKGWVECLMCARSFRLAEMMAKPPSELVVVGKQPSVASVHEESLAGATRRKAA